MSREAGYYSLIQYCPDPSREEFANLGVLLFSPGHQYIRAKTSPSNRRARQVFGGIPLDNDWLNSIKESLCERLVVERDRFRTLEDLRSFADTRANEIRISTPRSIMVDDPERQLEELYRELIGGPLTRTKRTVAIPKLAEAFASERFSERIQFNASVEIPIVKKPLTVPYAYRNGIQNLILPHQFSDIDQAARSLAFGAYMLAEHKPDSKLIVIPVVKPSATNDELLDRVARMFHEVRTRVVHQDDLDSFLEEVDREAHA